ncbi:hypothetical protein EB73_08400 [Mycobacterium sp. SWH-M3]|nr:hypothetical protein EB73_08400 [Mycobacterium sp. SWH-M3]
MTAWMCERLSIAITQSVDLAAQRPTLLTAATGVALVAVAMSIPVMIGSVFQQWAHARNLGVMDQILISVAATFFFGLPLAAVVMSAIAAIPSIPGQLGAVLLTAIALAVLRRTWNQRRNTPTAATTTNQDRR